MAIYYIIQILARYSNFFGNKFLSNDTFIKRPQIFKLILQEGLNIMHMVHSEMQKCNRTLKEKAGSKEILREREGKCCAK